MGVELDWQVEKEDGAWEVIAATDARSKRKIRWVIWRAATIVLVAAVAVGSAALRHRYRQALAWTTFQIQAAIDLEGRTLAQRDLDLYMRQQDEADPEWYVQQYARVHPDRLYSGPGMASANALGVRNGMEQGDPLIAQPKVREVEMRGDVAWVEVAAQRGAEPVRQARFYRRTDLGWKHTSPQAIFWGDAVERQVGSVLIHARERDVPHIDPLIAHMSRVAEDVGVALGHSMAITLEVDFSTQGAPGKPPSFSGHTLTLPSPWLSGIPLDGTWEQAYLNQLTYWTAYGVATQYLRSAGAAPLNRLQREIVDEYAYYCSQGSLAQTPVLWAIADRHGIDALPRVMHSLRTAPSASRFMTEWLSPYGAETEKSFPSR
jgi:hypothetical protein